MDFEESFDSFEVQLESCSYCGRNFAVENLQRHEKICEKTSRKRPVFDSSRQRSMQSSETRFQKQTASKLSNIGTTKKTKPANWRQKHEEFIQTIRAAREVTAAIKEGKPLPPPPPSAINPDYVQCPHCMRRFNATAAERHVVFCAEQSKRMSNRKPSASVATKQAAARASARLQYRPPTLRKKENSVPNYTSSVFNQRPTSASVKNSSASAARKKAPVSKTEWDSAVDTFAERKGTSKTGLRPSSGVLYSGSRYVTQQASKPAVRKVASKRESGKHYHSQMSDNLRSTDYSERHDGFKSSIDPGDGYSSHPDLQMLSDNPEPDFYNWIQPDELHANSEIKQSPAKFCHECGVRYPVSTAKFCCECGMKRIVI